MPPSVRAEGLTILQESANDVADIVFVHGLNGHAETTWTSKTTPVFCWIKNLPSQFSNFRVMTFGYDSVFQNGSGNFMGIRDHAGALLTQLRNKRQGLDAQRPLVFVCHSLGGLLVKQALVSSANKYNYGATYRSTIAIFFFGTPHRGSLILESSKRVLLLENLAKAAGYAIPPNLKSVLAPQSNELFGINDDFSDRKGAISIVNFYEKMETEAIGSLVVEPDSAVMHHQGEDNIGLKRTHQKLVRFDSSDDDTFNTVVETIAEKLSHILSVSPEDDEGRPAPDRAAMPYLLPAPEEPQDFEWSDTTRAKSRAT